MLFAMLHSSFAVPAQQMIIAYLDHQSESKQMAIKPVETRIVSDNPVHSDTSAPSPFKKYNDYKSTPVTERSHNNPTSANNDLKTNEQEAMIGISKEFPLDDPSDNLFKIAIHKAALGANDRVFLTYDLYGVSDLNGVSRSINDRLSTGGYIIKKQNEWSRQMEELDPSWLEEGTNRIMFNTPKGANHTYRIKNVSFIIEKGNANPVAQIVLQTKNITLQKDNTIYIKGFVKSEKTIQKIVAGKTQLEVRSNEFEGFIKLDPEANTNHSITITAYESDGPVAKEAIAISTLIEADKALAIEKELNSSTFDAKAFTALTFSVSDAKLIVSDSSMAVDKTIRISALRKVDIAPLESGMINVTKGETAYRFLPDGTQFDKPVKIEIAYDPLLLPSGYSPKDIKTFYFDTRSKHWVAVKVDSIDYKNHTIIAETTHFTDYINGIVQAPESPQTSSLTPTVMSAVKTADPSSEITLISPPQASQKGSANLSYPIKIPAGRNGMQPQLGIQYSNEGSNGWLGKGWDLNLPAISIDTRWGVPLLDKVKETEIYALNGEQLMFPENYLPNRHRNVGNLITTEQQNRNESGTKFFTTRKQGFSKVERFGNSPDTYYWKVTNTNGIISWYGGKTAVEPNAVLYADGGIVHWALYMTEDTYGNNVRYYYDNYTLTDQYGANSNLNGGKVFNPSRITYTGKDDADGNYEITFANESTIARTDVNINARLGIKQIEPYRLDKIYVKHKNANIRSYKFDYSTGKLGKSLLKTVTELNRNDELFYSHTFDYYDDVAQGNSDVYFSAGIDHNVCNDEYVPCTDTDGDGVCDENDHCPDVPGSPYNNGCPGNPNTQCAEVLFPIPLKDIVYRYKLDTPISGGLNYDVCNFIPVRIKNFRIGNNAPVAANNLYLTHYTPAGITNLCTATTDETTAIRNVNFDADATQWFTQLFSGMNVSNVQAVNTSYLSKMFRDNDHRLVRDTYYQFELSLLSPIPDLDFGYALEYRNMDTSTTFTTINPLHPPITTIHSAAGALVYIKVNNVLLSSTPYDLKNNRSVFINDFRQQYGANAEITEEEATFQIKITLMNPQSPLTSIQIGDNTYYFIPCKGFERTATTGTASDLPIAQKATPKSKSTYSDHFRNLASASHFEFQASIPVGDPDCPSLLNVDFLISGIMPSFNSAAALLGSTKSMSHTAGGYVGVGIGWNKLARTTTFGVGYNHSWDKGESLSSLIDINGDGLDDIVTKENGSIYYKAHRITRTYNENNEPQITHSFDPKKKINGIDEFFRQEGESSSVNFSISAGFSGAGAFAGKDNSKSKSKSDIYFTDANGDGLPDVVRGGKVYFNRLDANGNPSFIPDSKGTPNLVITAAIKDVEIPAEYFEEDIPMPNHDVVKVWEAPADGTIKIINDIALDDTTKEAMVTIEMKKPDPTPQNCYEVELILNPDNLVNKRYHYEFTFQGFERFLEPTPYAYHPTRITTFKIGNTASTVPNNFYLTHYRNGAETFLDCSTPSPIFYNCIRNTDLRGVLLPWLMQVPLTPYLDVNSNLEYYDTYMHNTSAYPGQCNGADIYSHFIIGFSFGFDSSVYIKTTFESNTIFTDGYVPTYCVTNNQQIGGTKPAYAQKELEEGYHVNPIRINNTPLQGTFDLVIHNAVGIEDLKAEIERVTGGQASIFGTRPVVLLNNDFYDTKLKIRIENASSPLTTMTVDGTVFNFIPCQNPGLPSNTPQTETCQLYGSLLNSSNATVNNVITSQNTNCNPNGGPLRVQKGDRIYFRVHSIDTGNPKVNWNPRIEYVDAHANTIDQNGQTPFKSSYSDGFILSHENETVFPGNGTAEISWEPFTVNSPTDEVTFEITKKVLSGAEGDNQQSFYDQIPEIPVYKKVCAPGSTTTVSPSVNAIAGVNIASIPVTGTATLPANSTVTVFYFRVKSASNVDWKQFEWKPKMVQVTSEQVIGDSGTSEGTLTGRQTQYPVPDYSIYKNYVNAAAYNQYELASLNSGNASLTILPSLTGVFASGDHGKLSFVVKKDGVFKGRKQITVTNGQVTYDTTTPIDLGTAGTSKIEIGYYIDDSKLPDANASLMDKIGMTNAKLATITTLQGTVDLFKANVNLFQKPNPKFGPMYRQWGQFLYNPKAVQGALPLNGLPGFLIKESALVITQQQADAIRNAVDAINNLNLGQSHLGSPEDDTNADAFEGMLDNFEATHASLYNTAFFATQPSRSFENNTLDERWIGMHQESYAAMLSARAAKINQSFEGFNDPDDESEQDVLQTGAYSIARYSKGTGKNLAGGGSVDVAPGFTVGVSGSKAPNGRSYTLTDYVDMNGDRYPDIVSKDKIQFTMRTGGLYPGAIRNTNLSGDIEKFESNGWGVSASGSYSEEARRDANSKGNSQDKSSAKPSGDKKGFSIGKPTFDLFSGNGSAGISGEFSKGKDKTVRLWADINGDGLTDLLEQTGNTMVVKLNFGANNYQPAQYSEWASFDLSKGSSSAFGGGVGFNWKVASIEAGVSVGKTVSNTDQNFIDINGDGLLDLVLSHPDSGLKIRLNQGNTLGPLTAWSDFKLQKSAQSVKSSLNASGTIAWIWPLIIPVCCTIPLKIPAVTASASTSYSTGKTLKTISDFDGDGYPDLIEEIRSNTIRVHSSRIRRTDMLKSVTNPLGGKFTIDYKVEKTTYDNPHAKWVMTSVKVEDGYDLTNDGVDSYTKEFQYEKARYDRREREFYGFETVKTAEYTMQESNGELVPVDVYRTSVANYHNTNYFLNGLLKESYVLKGNDPNKVYSKTINEYQIRPLDTLGNIDTQAASLPITFDVGGSEGRRTAAVILSKTQSFIYELQQNPIVRENQFVYDKYGRIIEYRDLGNTAVASDNYKSIIAYHDDNDLLDRNILTIPSSIQIKNDQGALLRKRVTSDINTVTGSIGKIEAVIDGIEIAAIQMEYDNYGNLQLITYPENSNGEAMFYRYYYDDPDGNFKYVTKIEDAFGYQSVSEYAPEWDAPLSTTDLAGNKVEYQYDLSGRIKSILGPKEKLLNDPYTIAFEYYPLYANTAPLECVAEQSFVPFAITKHFDPQHRGNDIETITFVDGIARVVQVKKDITLNVGTMDDPDNQEVLSISGKTEYDEFGRVIKQYHPNYETRNCSENYTVNNTESDYFSETLSDPLNRPVKTIDPEGNISEVEYSLAADPLGVIALKTRSVTDQNSQQQIISEIYKDILGRISATMNTGPDSELWTTFEYSPIGELMQYKDAEQLATSYKYDMLGRKKESTHPDNGTTRFDYDKANNLIKVQTANLANDQTLQPAERFIQYKYDFNRVKEIQYPATPGGANIANVNYKYGSSGNETGRLIYQEDATGNQSFLYGNMGEVIENIRVVVGPNIPTRSFTTKFEYDSWNRIQNMVYPDGETVFYSYDLGGNLVKIQGTFQGNGYDYLKRIDYDHYEQRNYVLYGNGTDMQYSYTPTLRRLDNHVARTSNQMEMFNNSYEFDKVGNVLGITNNAGTNPINGMGGSYTHSYNYDNLNRLTNAIGGFTGDEQQRELGNDANSTYKLDMEYNSSHGITRKTQEHIKNNDYVIPNTYKNVYSYYQGTHRIREIDDSAGLVETFKYDSNGNMRFRIKNEIQDKEYIWDESNRLRAVTDENNMQHYIYDAAGERILKAESDLEQLYENGTLVNQSGVTFNSYKTYPSAYIVVDGNGQYSKHYFAGSERIVSLIGDENASIFDLKQRATTGFDPDKLRQKQIKDLQNMAKSANKGTVSFKEFKSADESKANANGEQRRPMGNIYFFHPDYLGTATYLTDINGNPYQFFLNLPFGETMAEQHSLTENYSNPYKFNGKELDEATGLYYYGARYYDPRISTWASVDPLAEKFPSWNPYNYTMQNPINLIDPDGRMAIDALEDNDDWYENTTTGKLEWRNSQEATINDNKGSWKNIGEELLTFDGKDLTYYTQEKLPDGNLKLNSTSFPAVSGRQKKDGTFDYSKEAQAKSSKGPLPEGDYYINPSAIQWWTDQSFITRTIAPVKKGTWPGGLFAWGIARVWITPQEVSITNPTTGESVLRNNFSIHGGTSPGSAGCIDLTTKDLPFFRMLEKSKESKIKLRVSY